MARARGILMTGFPVCSLARENVARLGLRSSWSAGSGHGLMRDLVVGAPQRAHRDKDYGYM